MDIPSGDDGRPRRASARRAAAARSGVPLRYPFTVERWVFGISAAVCVAMCLGGSVRYAVEGVPQAGRLAWSDAQIGILVGFFCGALLGGIYGNSIRVDRNLVVVRLFLVRTVFSWSDIVSVEQLGPQGGKVTLRNGRKVRINWTSHQLNRFMAPRVDLQDIFIGRWELFRVDNGPNAYSRQLDWIPLIACAAMTVANAATFVITRIIVLG
jgi:hypothetical protein